ncbi:MAG: HEPN domain-containing protein [Bacteroidales bacterium]
MTTYNQQDYIDYRLQKAKETLLEVEILINNEFWNTSINRMYYACFYAVSALLIKYNVETASHSGARQKFGELFVKTGRINRDLAKQYTALFEKRSKGDYNDFFDFDKETVTKLYPLTQALISRIEELINE